LINLHNHSSTEVNNAFKYLTDQSTQNLNNRDDFNGYLRAYEFATKNSDISKRRNSEKATLTRLRNDFQNELPELEKQLNDHLIMSDIKFKEFAESIDKCKEDKEKTYADWYINSKGEFEELIKTSTQSIEDLEKTYEKKLELEAPARYWKRKSEKFYKEGKSARTILLWVITLSAAVLIILLLTSPKWIFESVFNGNATAVIRWSLIFITLLSIVVYAIRAISKVMFSAYHLARDAEERHTL